LLWGSDWPFAAFEDSMRYEYAVASFKDWVPDAGMRHIIGGETAFKLYFA
jgi:predicted TIM-barrel fold metal-dependent hydrolase